MVCDSTQYYLTTGCNCKSVTFVEVWTGRIQHDNAKGSTQRKSNLPLTSCLLALAAAMEPCTAIYTAVKVWSFLLIHFGSAVTGIMSMCKSFPWTCCCGAEFSVWSTDGAGGAASSSGVTFCKQCENGQLYVMWMIAISLGHLLTKERK